MRRVAFGTALVALSLWLWAGCGGPRLSLLDPSRPVGPRPTHFGLSLPVPVTAAAPPPVDSVRTGLPERRLPVILRIDSKGRVGSVTFESAVDSIAAGASPGYLKRLRFEPGLRDGVPTEVRLRIELQSGAGLSPQVIFPVGPNREIARAETYWEAMKAEGIEPARLAMFPPFYYIPSSRITGNRYDFKTYRVDLDSLGRVTAVAPFVTTHDAFTDQIATAAVWAEYEPMRLDGRPVPSTSYLAVALFSEADYPTSRWYADSTETLSDKERLRVRLLPDTVGEMLPAIAKRDWSGPIIDSAAWEPHDELISARITVDTTGLATLKEVSTDSWKVRRVLMGRAFDRGFYPARGYSGELLRWGGLAYVRYPDSTRVRVWFDWAPVSDPALESAR